MAKIKPIKSDLEASKAQDKKSPARKKAARDTLKSLRRDVEVIETRLKQADTHTDKSVQALQTAFMILEQRLGEKSDTQYATLRTYVQQVSEQLKQYNIKTREAVRQSLKTALQSQDIGTLDTALKSVQERLDYSQIEQSEALRKVNSHVADLALAIDTRIKTESRTRQADIKILTEKVDIGLAKTSVKLDKIETATADAIRNLGSKVGQVADEIHTKTARSAAALQQKLIEREDASRNNLKNLQARLERRIEGLEETQRNLDSYTDRTVANLTARIDSLEYGLTTGFAPAQSALAADLPAQNTGQIPADIDDSFTPNPDVETKLAYETPAISSNLDELKAHAQETALQTQAETSTIEEFVPTEYVAQQQPPQASVLQNQFAYQAPQNSYAADMNSGDYNTGDLYPNPYVADQTAGDPYTAQPSFDQTPPTQFEAPYALPQDNVMPFEAPDNILEADLPYENPAYGETDTQKRPGGFGLKDKNPISLLGNRNLRVAGLAVAVATVGFFALRGGLPFMSGQNTGSQDPVRTADTRPQISPVGSELTAPIGDYADNRGIGSDDLAASELNTIEAAANAGNSVAQFQLGLSYLESNRTEEGVNLIRSSANQDQPAAQYRLAKLYETGTGVSADPAMARQLTERAARNGNRIAMHELALYYAEGRGGVKADIKTAAQWFEKAAERGVVDSQFNLGVLFESGQGLPRNTSDAFVWYSIAAKQGDQFARDRVNIIKGQLNEVDLKTATNRIEAFQPMAIDEQANGIFKDLPWTTQTVSQIGPTPEMVRNSQELLTELGYDVGRPDGAMGPRTREAIISFQRTTGLPQTGVVNMALIANLEAANNS